MARRSRTIAGALTVALACAAGAAPSASAAQQDEGRGPRAQASQLDTGTLLGPVRDLLYDVADVQGLPPAAQQLVREVADLLAGTPNGQPLDPSLLAPVEQLLRDLAATPDVPPALSDVLTDLADLLGGSAGGGASGLPIEDLSVVPQTIDELDQLITALEDGAAPTGTLLAPVAQLLDEVAATPSLSAPLPDLLRELAGLIRGTSGELDPLLASQLERVLSSVANTPGLTAEQRTVIERTATLIAQGGSSRAAGPRAVVATKRDRAVIKRIRVNRARTRIAVRIACPRRAPATCATRVTASFAGRKAAKPKRVRIADGRSKVVRLRMVRAARSASARQGGRLKVRVVTRFGTRSFAHAKAVRVRARR
jgi:hypothetical protein